MSTDAEDLGQTTDGEPEVKNKNCNKSEKGNTIHKLGKKEKSINQ